MYAGRKKRFVLFAVLGFTLGHIFRVSSTPSGTTPVGSTASARDSTLSAPGSSSSAPGGSSSASENETIIDAFEEYNKWYKQCLKLSPTERGVTFTKTELTRRIPPEIFAKLDLMSRLNDFMDELTVEAECFEWILNKRKNTFDDLIVTFYVQHLCRHFGSFLEGQWMALDFEYKYELEPNNKTEERKKYINDLFLAYALLTLFRTTCDYRDNIDKLTKMRRITVDQDCSEEEFAERQKVISDEGRELKQIVRSKEAASIKSYMNMINFTNEFIQRFSPRVSLPRPCYVMDTNEEYTNLLKNISGSTLLDAAAKFSGSRVIEIIKIIVLNDNEVTRPETRKKSKRDPGM